jgi:hypothetical protein
MTKFFAEVAQLDLIRIKLCVLHSCQKSIEISDSFLGTLEILHRIIDEFSHQLSERFPAYQMLFSVLFGFDKVALC